MNSTKKRKSYFYKSANEKRVKLYLQSGMKGFFCTSRGREDQCIREALNLLDEYTLKMNPPLDTIESADVDIDSELQKEIEQLKSETVHTKTFQVVDAEVKSCVFIKSTIKDPVELANFIFKDIAQQKKFKSKFLVRLIPIEVTCKASLDAIKKAADQILDRHFKGEPTTFAVVYNCRYNNSLVRQEVIHSIFLLVQDRNLKHTVNIQSPEKAVIVEIIKGVCGLSVVTNYPSFKKFNLMSVASQDGHHEVAATKTAASLGKDDEPQNKISENEVSEGLVSDQLVDNNDQSQPKDSIDVNTEDCLVEEPSSEIVANENYSLALENPRQSSPTEK